MAQPFKALLDCLPKRSSMAKDKFKKCLIVFSKRFCFLAHTPTPEPLACGAAGPRIAYSVDIRFKVVYKVSSVCAQATEPLACEHRSIFGRGGQKRPPEIRLCSQAAEPPVCCSLCSRHFHFPYIKPSGASMKDVPGLKGAKKYGKFPFLHRSFYF